MWDVPKGPDKSGESADSSQSEGFGYSTEDPMPAALDAEGKPGNRMRSGMRFLAVPPGSDSGMRRRHCDHRTVARAMSGLSQATRGPMICSTSSAVVSLTCWASPTTGPSTRTSWVRSTNSSLPWSQVSQSCARRTRRMRTPLWRGWITCAIRANDSAGRTGRSWPSGLARHLSSLALYRLR